MHQQLQVNGALVPGNGYNWVRLTLVTVVEQPGNQSGKWLTVMSAVGQQYPLSKRHLEKHKTTSTCWQQRPPRVELWGHRHPAGGRPRCSRLSPAAAVSRWGIVDTLGLEQEFKSHIELLPYINSKTMVKIKQGNIPLCSDDPLCANSLFSSPGNSLTYREDEMSIDTWLSI